MSKKLDLSGKIFGRIKVIGRHDGERKTPNTYWVCECQCEYKTQMIVRGTYLKRGQTQSCGKCNVSKNSFYEKDGYMVCVSRQGDEILFDKEDYPMIETRTWSTNGRYPLAKFNNKSVNLHTVLMNTPKDMCVDHINGNRLDNRRINLRICSNSQNHFNRQVSFGQSSFKGVSRTRKNKTNPWRATIKKDGKTITIGTYKTEEEAAIAYDQMALMLFGDYAKINFPS